jgi:hypothetical protein
MRTKGKRLDLVQNQQTSARRGAAGLIYSTYNKTLLRPPISKILATHTMPHQIHERSNTLTPSLVFGLVTTSPEPRPTVVMLLPSGVTSHRFAIRQSQHPYLPGFPSVR